MNLIQICLRRPVGVSVGVLLTVLFGLLALFSIPVQLTPNVDVTVVTVTTRWSGANPQEIEREIVDRQEEQLRSVNGMEKMTSASRDNEATITLEFYPGVTKSDALRDVADKLRQVSGYPVEVDEPTIQAADQSVDNPIAWLILYPAPGEEERVTELYDFADDNIKPYLDRVPGVASVNIYGGKEREVQVRVDAGRLASRGLTFSDVQQALRRQNVNASAGFSSEGKRDYTVRAVGQYESLDEIRDTVIAYTPGGPVYVRDVAEVRDSFKRAFSMVRSKGTTVLAFPVRREVGTNVLTVMAGVRAAIERVNKEVLSARGMRLELTQVYDETVYINQSIAMVRNNIIYGGTLAVVVLMLFLRNWRATLAVALSIPISVIATFLVVVGAGRTLNVISLAGIAFAVGMVVDNCIVVLENIYRHRQMGKDVMTSCFDGTNEIWAAVLASTLTTMAVFIPVIFVEQEAGQLFRDISIATAAAVALSLVVAVTVTPVLASRLLRVGAGRASAARAERHVSTGPIAESAGWLVGLLLRVPFALRALFVAGVTAGVLWLGLRLVPDTTYLPSGNRNLVFGFLLTPPGYSLEEFRRMAAVVEGGLRPYWEAQPDSPEHKELDRRWLERVEAMLAAGAIPEADDPKSSALQRGRARREWLTPPPLIDNFFFVSFAGGCFMGASSRDPARVKPLVRLLTQAGAEVPGVFPVFFQTELFSFGGGNTAEIQIRGDDLAQVTQAASAMQRACMREFGSYPNSDPRNFAMGRPEVRIEPDRERAADLGLSAADIALIVEAAVDGAYVGDFRVAGGNTVDISLYAERDASRPTQEIGALPIYTTAGPATLSSAVKMIDTTALEQINHIERQRAVTLTVRPPESLPLESVIRRVTDRETGIETTLRGAKEIAPTVLVSLTGNADKLTEARNAMVGAWHGFTLDTLVSLVNGRFFLSVLIVYLLLCALYESWVYPFVIMFSVPLAVFGGLLGLWVCHVGTLLTTNQPVQQLDVLTFLGFVILVGTVVNNAILLVDQSLQNHRLHGMAAGQAIREATRTRVRPVLMTSLTTIFGQLPLALMPGAGSELYRGLASVMLGGLLVASLGTLVLVPAALSLVMGVRAPRAAAPAAASPAPQPAFRRDV
ncbi:MAG: efflux RND transporter permease subunit [Phycisphaerae bacterium]|nr:efflux RND transporter permease subunit [Phycisphaerae bacterium]MCZ2399464.1 efflux RND transporter permease subunit [Phycisphaerae bacterium]